MRVIFSGLVPSETMSGNISLASASLTWRVGPPSFFMTRLPSTKGCPTLRAVRRVGVSNVSTLQKKSLQSLLCRRFLLGLRSRAMHPDVSPFLYVHDLALLAPVHLT